MFFNLRCLLLCVLKDGTESGRMDRDMDVNGRGF